MAKHHKDLTVDKISEKAMESADTHGVDPLTMRSLAKELGVTPMSLYRHVANKEDLLDKMVDVVFSEIELPIIGGDWHTEMRKRAISTREVLLRHKWALGLVDSRTQPGLAMQIHHNAVIGTLREGGFSVPFTTQAFTILDAYIFGFILQEISLPLGDEGDFSEVGESAVATLDNNAFPYLTELALDNLAQSNFNFGDLFKTGLNIVLEGLAIYANA